MNDIIDKKYSDVPVLILAYNRPEQLQFLLNEIKDTFLNIYISVDGPKDDTDKSCLVCQKIAADFLEGKEQQLNTSNINKGVRGGVTDSIDWFYSHEKAGVILEDDLSLVLDNLLSYIAVYKNICDDVTILNLSSFVHVSVVKSRASALLSNDFFMWGWYAEKEFWVSYRECENMFTAKKFYKLVKYFSSIRDKLHWGIIFFRLYRNQIDSWGYRVSIFCYINNITLLTPTNLLCVNKGIRDGANYSSKTFYNKKLDSLKTNKLNALIKYSGLRINDKLSRDNYLIRVNPTWYQIIKNTIFLIMPIDKKLKSIFKK